MTASKVCKTSHVASPHKKKMGQPTGVGARLLAPPSFFSAKQQSNQNSWKSKPNLTDKQDVEKKHQLRRQTLLYEGSVARERLTNKLTVYLHLFDSSSSRIRLQVKQVHRVRTFCACTYFFQGRLSREMANRSRCLNCFGAWRNWRRLILHEYVSILEMML